MIRSNNLVVQPNVAEGQIDQSFILKSIYNGGLLEYLKIYSYQSDAPYVIFSSPVGAYADWNFGNSDFNGNKNFNNFSSFNGTVDFSGATITGLNITAKFA